MGIFPTSLFYNKNLDSQRCNRIYGSKLFLFIYIHLTNLGTSKSKEQLIDLEWSSKISLPHHISLTKNGSQKEKKQDLVFLFLKEKTDDRPIP
jgi:hypothetical protein